MNEKSGIKAYIVYPVERSGWTYKTKVSQGKVFLIQSDAEAYLEEKKATVENNSHNFWHIDEVEVN